MKHIKKFESNGLPEVEPTNTTEVYVVGTEGERHEDLVFEGVYTKSGLTKSHLIPVENSWENIFNELESSGEEFLEFGFVDRTEYTLSPEDEKMIMSEGGWDWCQEEFGDYEGPINRKIAKVKIRN